MGDPLEISVQEPVARLEAARADREQARTHVDRIGADSLRTLRETCDDMADLIDRYDETAVGDVDFAAFIEFQEEIDRFTQRLPDGLLERETFEAIDDLFQQRRLTESDFERAREKLASARATHAPLSDLEDAIDRYRDARATIVKRRDEMDDAIADLERLRRLGDADLDAPIRRLRDPIDRYNEAVADAFSTYKSETPARDVLDFVETTSAFPLASFREPPADLHDFVDENDVGTQPIATLLEYVTYSRSKLDHYVDDADALKRNVATQETYLNRLNGDPLTVAWPPPERLELRYVCEEYISVVGRFAPDVVSRLRTVRELTRLDEYDRLRTSAVAREKLTDAERERLREGSITADLEELREKRDVLAETLSEYPQR